MSMATFGVAGSLVQARVRDLAAAMGQSLDALVDGLAPAEVVGLGFVSTADCSRLTPVANTRHDLQAALQHQADPAREARPGFDRERFYRWCARQWPLTGGEGEADAPLRATWAAISAIRDEVSPEEREAWPAIQFEAAMFAMAYLRDFGWFDKFPHAVRVFTVDDDQLELTVRSRWLGLLNLDEWDEIEAYLATEH